MNNEENKYDLIKFEDGNFSLDVNVSPDEDTVWLSTNEIALLFERDEKTIRKHINNVFLEKEVDKNNNTHFLRVVGVKQKVAFYSLNVIISVGYRVKSFRGVKFRQWANRILKQYLLKGSVINEERCLSCTSNIISLQNKVESIESKINNLENDVHSENSKAFFEGEIVEPYTFIRHIFFLAKENLTITDFYADNYLISMLKDIKVNITIVTSSSSYLNKIVLPNNINVVYDNDIHGRYIFIDDKYVYALDNSFNNIGKKKFVIMKLDNITKEMLLKK
ncbi:MAG: virulence RhuM family protein [Acholeplasmatales bacterium]|nr:virulence RhuM family protein [Acholeplasmatales bacterium]